MLPPFWRNQPSKFYLSTALIGLCFSISAFTQNLPLSLPANVEYPGIIQTFEKIIQIDQTKFKNQVDNLIKNGKTQNGVSSMTNIRLGTDFLNSVILHSDPGYIKLASVSLCRFYETIMADLLKSAEGKIKNVVVNYSDKDGKNDTIILSKRDFLSKVINQECPEMKSIIDKYQIKNLVKTIKDVNFEVPTGKESCENIVRNWLSDPNTPYLCQIHEYMKDARSGSAGHALAKILEDKITPIQKDYLANLCPHLDDAENFCEEFLNVSFWSKVSSGRESRIYAEDICSALTGIKDPSNNQVKLCAERLKKENDLCLYPMGNNQGLNPQPECDSLSLALNHSKIRSDYKDCPASSDEHGITNIGRILLNITNEPIQPTQGQCSSIPAGIVFDFNKRFDNDENWKLEACYENKISEKEICFKTYFGAYGNQPEAYTNVVKNILQLTRGADPSVKCQMVESGEYNPTLLKFKSGCHIIYDKNNCFLSHCKHRILYNDRTIDLVKIKNRLNLAYFPITVNEERFSQHYLLTRDFKQSARSLNNLSGITKFFKTSKQGIIHGMGCAEDLLPSFFKMKAMNQCTPLPFIIDGMIKNGDKTVFVTRTSLDTLQAPRLISWSSIYSAVKTYQKLQPLKMWTLYGFN